MDHPDWQTTLSSVRERNLYAFDESLFCDVAFSVEDSNGDRVTFQAHKYVLAISSPVFEAMFYGKLAETGRTIDLQDCTKEGLQELLRYVYSDEVNLTRSTVMEIMLLADKYMLPFLVEKCNEYLEKELKPEDVFSVLPQIQIIENEEAKQHCWAIVDIHTRRAVSSKSFLNVSREMLCEILSRDNLHIEEIELFQAVDRWVSVKIKNKKTRKVKEGRKRAELGNKVVQLIRFPVMSQKEFAEHVLTSDILIKSEMVEIMQIFSSVEPRKSSFNSKRRKGQQRERWTNVRFHGMSRNRGLGFTNSRGPHSACIDFQVNKPIFLAGVRLFGATNHQYQVQMEIYKANDNSPLYQTNGYVSYNTGKDLIDGLYSGFEVLINPPLFLDSNMRYAIAANIRGPPCDSRTFNSTVSKTNVECDDIKITFMNSGHGNCFQFPAFLIN